VTASSRPVPLAIAVAGAVLATVALGPAAHASNIQVEFDTKAAETALNALARTSINDDTLSHLLRMPGYELVIAQRHQRAGFGANRNTVARELAAEIQAAAAGNEQDGGSFIRAKRNLRAYRNALVEFRRVSGMMQWQITSRLNEMLPPASDFTATAYLVVGGDAAGFAFSHRDDIAIRVDDFVGGPDGAQIDVDRLAAVLAHELFHVGFRAAGGLAPREADDPSWRALAENWGPDFVGEVWRASDVGSWDASAIEPRLQAWVPSGLAQPATVDRLLSGLSRLMNEGCAVYAETDLYTFSGSDRLQREHAFWLSELDSDFDALAELTSQFIRGASPGDLEALIRSGLRANGPFYRIGYIMAERIDRYTGRRALVQAIDGGPLEFFETYFETHPIGEKHVDSNSRMDIERLTREIRALGAFDPTG